MSKAEKWGFWEKKQRNNTEKYEYEFSLLL